ncbi:hypothetical protein [Clostridioides sp. ZZV14-6044]
MLDNLNKKKMPACFFV